MMPTGRLPSTTTTAPTDALSMASATAAIVAFGGAITGALVIA